MKHTRIFLLALIFFIGPFYSFNTNSFELGQKAFAENSDWGWYESYTITVIETRDFHGTDGEMCFAEIESSYSGYTCEYANNICNPVASTHRKSVMIASACIELVE